MKHINGKTVMKNFGDNMKKNKKLFLATSVAIGLAAINMPSYALLPAATPASAPASAPQVVSVAPVAIDAGTGNAYEKEVTPLLREISKKKSLLELRRLDRELEKLDEEALKAQADREKASTPTPTASSLPFTPQVFPNGIPSAQTMSAPTVQDNKEVKVFMIYGYDNNLYAKVGFGTQGGYVVKKGDILPDGRTVQQVTSNFIEVSKSTSSKKSSTEKIFVTAGASSDETSGANNQNRGGTASSALAPSGAPVNIPAQPPMLSPIPVK